MFPLLCQSNNLLYNIISLSNGNRFFTSHHNKLQWRLRLLWDNSKIILTLDSQQTLYSSSLISNKIGWDSFHNESVNLYILSLLHIKYICFEYELFLLISTI